MGNPPSPLPQAVGTPSCGRPPLPPGITEAQIQFTGLPVNPRPWDPQGIHPKNTAGRGPSGKREGKGGNTVGPGGKSGLLSPVAPALGLVDALAAWAPGSVFLGCVSGSWTLWSPPKLQGSGPGQCLLQHQLHSPPTPPTLNHCLSEKPTQCLGAVRISWLVLEQALSLAGFVPSVPSVGFPWPRDSVH